MRHTVFEAETQKKLKAKKMNIKNNFFSGGRKEESNGDSCHTIGRQYIPEGHNDHFENPAV